MICGRCSYFEAVEFLVAQRLKSKAHDENGVVVGTRAKAEARLVI
jgi:hypothetical protein